MHNNRCTGSQSALWEREKLSLVIRNHQQGGNNDKIYEEVQQLAE